MKKVFEGQEQKKKRVLIITLTAIALALIVGVVFFFLFRDQIRATTMRILRIEGVVNLEEDGLEKTISDNLRLKDGNAINTAEKSLASIGLDDTKIVTLDELSRAEIEKAGKKLDLNITRGSLFFEVSKPLEESESFNIHTSTMVVGIRGTSGYVTVAGGQEGLIITDGTVHVIGTNPTTGEVKEIDVSAGNRVTVYLYNDREVDSIMFEVEPITERDLPEFVLQYQREHPELLDKVIAQTGWDKPWILGEGEQEEVEVNTVKPSPDKTEDTKPEVKKPEEPKEKPEQEEPAEETHTRGASEEDLQRAKDAVVSIDPATGIITLADGTLFDPAFYARMNPDVVAKYGNDPMALLAHWLAFGRREGRPPIAIPTPTPTPTFDPNAGGGGSSDWHPSEEEEEEEPTPTPTPEPVGSTGEFNSSANPIAVYVGGAQIGQLNDQTYILELGPGNVGTVRLPLTLSDTNGGADVHINKLSDISWGDSFADTCTVVDASGNRVVVDFIAGIFRIETAGATINCVDYSDLGAQVAAAGL